jgi:NadR type nicotinamide-nucleotide adenylyltransferase
LVKKVVLTGPESTGKTTLAQQLAAHFDALWAPEFAREYIEKLNRPYVRNDLLAIAKGQIYQENRLLKKAKKLLFCDTDLITVKIWAEYKYGDCDPWILQNIAERHYDFYLLCAPDLPWQADSQRENPSDRDRLFDLYKETLLRLGKKFVEISGLENERFELAAGEIQALI